MGLAGFTGVDQLIIAVVVRRDRFAFPAAIAASQHGVQSVGEAQAGGEVARLLFFTAVLALQAGGAVGEFNDAAHVLPLVDVFVARRRCVALEWRSVALFGLAVPDHQLMFASKQ